MSITDNKEDYVDLKIASITKTLTDGESVILENVSYKGTVFGLTELMAVIIEATGTMEGLEDFLNIDLQGETDPEQATGVEDERVHDETIYTKLGGEVVKTKGKHKIRNMEDAIDLAFDEYPISSEPDSTILDASTKRLGSGD